MNKRTINGVEVIKLQIEGFTGEKALWAAVILLTVQDAFYLVRQMKIEKADKTKREMLTRRFIKDFESNFFISIIDVMGINYKEFKNHITKILNT